MPRKEREDLTGQVFSELTVLHESKKRYSWVCQCSCGKTTQVRGQELISNHTKSCGHLQQEARRRINKNWEISVEIDNRLTDAQRRRRQYLYNKSKW